MSDDTTMSSNSEMDCVAVARDDILDAYLMGRLTETDRERFEAHYFECARCFEDLRALQLIRGQLSEAGKAGSTRVRRERSWWPAAAASLAAAAVLIGLLLWTRPGDTVPPQAAVSAPAPAPISSSGPPPVASEISLAELARFEPPVYEAVTLRGAADEAAKHFAAGMQHYGAGNYRLAAQELAAAEQLQPDRAHIRFFLGICHLMLQQDDLAIDELRRTIALGDSPYLEDARFYLAKAFLRRNDRAGAEEQLKAIAALRGVKAEESQKLLTELNRLEPTSR